MIAAGCGYAIQLRGDSWKSGFWADIVSDSKAHIGRRRVGEVYQ
jgi:hypothetical protein